MRYSIASQALCGAITVSALALPSTHDNKRAQHVDISEFKSFPTADPKVYYDKADDKVREFFKNGMFNDGPMDEFGKWVDRPMAILEFVKDKLELHFEEIADHLETIREKFEDHFEKPHDQPRGQDGAPMLKSKVNAFTKGVGGGTFPSFDDFDHVFGKPATDASQPNEPSEPSEPSKPSQSSQSSQSSPSSQSSSSSQSSPSSQSTSSSQSSQPSQPSQPGQPIQPILPVKASDNAKDDEGAAAAAAACNPSNSHVRFEWSNYSRNDRTAFVKAIKCLQDKPSGGSQYAGSRNRYEDLISVHRGMTADIHQTAAFLVWHRYFVWVFEQLLRDECGFDRALPWWDETKHAGAFAASDVFTNEWFGNLPAKTSDGQGTCIESGEFAGTTLHVGPGNNNNDHCLSRAVDESQTAQCNKDFTNSCLAMGSYEEFRDCFELGPHGYGHNGIGAVMAEVSASVGDPVFFMHHLFVDHTFRIWQNANPSRRTTISGCANKANPCAPITLDTRLSSNGLRPDMAVRDVLNTLSGAVCYRYDY